MCVVCAAGGGSASAGVTSIIQFLTALSPVIGLFAYRVYTANSITAYATKRYWHWFIGGILATYTSVIYILIAGISYGLIWYTPQFAQWAPVAALIGLPLFTAWFLKRLQRSGTVASHWHTFVITIVSTIPYAIAIIIYTANYTSANYTVVTDSTIHQLHVVFGLLLPLILGITTAHMVFIHLEYVRWKSKKVLQNL